MARKRKTGARRRNPVARALRQPALKPRVVASRTRYRRDRNGALVRAALRDHDGET